MRNAVAKRLPRDLTPFLARIRDWCAECEETHRILHPEMVSVLSCAIAQRIAAVPIREQREALIAEVLEAIPNLVDKVMVDTAKPGT